MRRVAPGGCLPPRAGDPANAQRVPARASPVTVPFACRAQAMHTPTNTISGRPCVVSTTNLRQHLRQGPPPARASEGQARHQAQPRAAPAAPPRLDGSARRGRRRLEHLHRRPAHHAARRARAPAGRARSPARRRRPGPATRTGHWNRSRRRGEHRPVPRAQRWPGAAVLSARRADERRHSLQQRRRRRGSRGRQPGRCDRRGRRRGSPAAPHADRPARSVQPEPPASHGGERRPASDRGRLARAAHLAGADRPLPDHRRALRHRAADLRQQGGPGREPRRHRGEDRPLPGARPPRPADQRRHRRRAGRAARRAGRDDHRPGRAVRRGQIDAADRHPARLRAAHG